MKVLNVFTCGAILPVLGFILAVACSNSPLALAGTGDDTTTTAGSGDRYKTTVKRKTEGKVSDEDFQQVSLLGTRIVKHLNRASEYLLDEPR